MAVNLDKWAKEHSYNLAQMLGDGESVVGKLKDVKEQTNAFGNEVLVYFIETPDGVKQLVSGSATIASQFNKLNRKNFVKITRNLDPKTGRTKFWEIEEVVDTEGKVSAKEAKEIEKEMAG